MRPNKICLALISIALATTAMADDDDDDRYCDYTDGQVCAAQGCFDTKYQDWILPSPQAGYCSYKVQSQPNHTFLRYLPSQAVEPTIACTQVANCTLSCLAQPEGSGLSYQWSKQGPAGFNPTPQSHENTAMVDIYTPNSITVRVTVSSPYGLNGTAGWTVVPNSVCFPD